MKTYVYRRYGAPDVLELTERPTPVPGDHDLLIRVRATTVSSADWRLRSLDMPHGFKLIGRVAIGIRKPRNPILGAELSGVVEAVGRAVTSFKVGDQVFAFSGATLACHAEYKCVPENGAVALKPPNLSFEQAAALCFGGATMLDYFRSAQLRRDERVLVNGASGTVGSAAVQLAKHAGAHVTGVCSSANLELVRSIGADEVVDYTQCDFTQAQARYDVIVDTVGNAPFSRSAAALAPGGRLLLILATLPELLKAPWHSLTSGKKVIAGPAAERPEYVRRLGELAAEGRFTPLVDRCYPFDRMVEAHRYVDRGHKKGSVVITLDAHGVRAPSPAESDGVAQMPLLRPATREDIPAMHRVRVAVRENRLTSSVIGEADYLPAIEEHGRGWVAEEQGSVVGFAVGDARDGNIWALFVHPDHEGRGHGRRLHDAMVSWLWSQGLAELWLTTEPHTRAHAFYEAAGWRRAGSTESGELRFEMRGPVSGSGGQFPRRPARH